MRRRLILSDVFPAASGWIMNMRADGALCLAQIGPCGPFPPANPTLAGAPSQGEAAEKPLKKLVMK